MKREKSPLFAGILNFFFWGIGYLYLDKKTDKAFYLIGLYFLIWIFSFWYLTVAGPLDFAGIFWIITWFLLISSYISYDAYKTGRHRK
jgi:hypothetical protein